MLMPISQSCWQLNRTKHNKRGLQPAMLLNSSHPLLTRCSRWSCAWAWLGHTPVPVPKPDGLSQQMCCRQVEEPTPQIQGFDPGALEAWLARNSKASLVGTARPGSPPCLQSGAAQRSLPISTLQCVRLMQHLLQGSRG